jgi:MscS family membrane protein
LNLRFPSILAYQILSVSSISVIHKTGFSILLFFTLKCLISIIDFIAFFWEEEAKKSIEKKDDQLILFLKSIAKAVTYIVGTLIILKSAFNFDLGAVLAGLSIVGAALALAAKESIENLIASFIIFFDQPFVVDDKVQVNNIIGKIEYIGLRSTTIRTPEHTLVTVPNKQMVDSIVDNMSKRNGRKTEMQLELEPQTPIDKINVLSSRVEGYFMNHPVIMNNFDLYISDLRKNSLVLYIKFHLPETESSEYRKIQQDFILFLKQSTDELNIKTV